MLVELGKRVGVGGRSEVRVARMAVVGAAAAASKSWLWSAVKALG